MDYKTPAKATTVTSLIATLKEHGVTAEMVNTGNEALEKLKSYIPQGASVMNGSSTTLQQIGFVDYLKSDMHGWNNLHAAIVAEKNPEQQALLRQQAVFSDYYLGSAHAVTEAGELVFASASGSQLPHLVYTSPNIILVIGTQKIVPTLVDALKRIKEHVFPLEDARMKSVGYGGSIFAKLFVLFREPEMMKRTVRVIFVNEELGF